MVSHNNFVTFHKDYCQFNRFIPIFKNQLKTADYAS
jgi:hypothetical protein